jgi:AcrR family transcriptional regulator
MPQHNAGSPVRGSTVVKAANARSEGARPSHNLLGQRLGRKGHDTRERILAAAEKLLLAEESETPFSLSAVAREASLGMTTLYLYFNDLSELFLAVLDRTMESAEAAYIERLRTRWADEDLGERCQNFVASYCHFWVRHGRILHLRDSYIDAGDERLREHRITTAEPVIKLVVEQMDGDRDNALSPTWGMAIALWTGVERSMSLVRDETFKTRTVNADVQAAFFLRAQARLMELGIRDYRALAKR